MTDDPTADPTAGGGYAARRISYTAGELTERAAAPTPLQQFERWYADAGRDGVPEPNAMVLATVAAGVDGVCRPSARTVLLKQADRRGFVFYTNYASRKGRQLDAGGRVALVFPWHQVQRQVCALGVAERVPADESRAYFGSRPWDSRIGAWASRQSEPVADREELVRRFAQCAERWPDHGSPDDVPMPTEWGGYLVRALEVEFWQGRPSRLHDRLAYCARGSADTPADLDDGTAWRVERRQP